MNSSSHSTEWNSIHVHCMYCSLIYNNDVDFVEHVAICSQKCFIHRDVFRHVFSLACSRLSVVEDTVSKKRASERKKRESMFLALVFPRFFSHSSSFFRSSLTTKNLEESLEQAMFYLLIHQKSACKAFLLKFYLNANLIQYTKCKLDIVIQFCFVQPKYWLARSSFVLKNLTDLIFYVWLIWLPTGLWTVSFYLLIQGFQ